jgi:hypothetical protein
VNTTIVKWSENCGFLFVLLTIQGIKMSPPSWVKPSSLPWVQGYKWKKEKRKQSLCPLTAGDWVPAVDNGDRLTLPD